MIIYIYFRFAIAPILATLLHKCICSNLLKVMTIYVYIILRCHLYVRIVCIIFNFLFSYREFEQVKLYLNLLQWNPPLSNMENSSSRTCRTKMDQRAIRSVFYTKLIQAFSSSLSWQIRIIELIFQSLISIISNPHNLRILKY